MSRVPVIQALRIAFADGRARFEAVFFALAVFMLFVLVPVWTTPGDDVGFQLHLLKPGVIALLVALAILNGILIEMQLYLHRQHRAEPKATEAAEAVGFVGIVVSTILATLGCAACYSSILALFGLGGTIFVVTNRWWFAAGALGLTLIALAHTSRRVAGVCTSCKVPRRKSDGHAP